MTAEVVWSAVQGVGTIAAVVVALWLDHRNSKRHDEELTAAVRRADTQLADQLARADRLRREDDELRRRADARALYIRLTLQIAESYEQWKGSPAANAEATNRIRASLSALPVPYLQVLRHEFGVHPDARDEGRIKSYGDNRRAKAADEITALLYQLTGAGTAQDYEPLGSPTARRPKEPTQYP